MFNNISEFKKWFEGSAVAENGMPLIQFHGTPYPLYEEPFWYFTHFGTANCAQIFLKTAIKENKPGSLYPVALSIKNPLSMKDIDHHGASHVAQALKDMGIFSSEEAEEIKKISQCISVSTRGISTHYKDGKRNANALSAYRNITKLSKSFSDGSFSHPKPNIFHSFLGYERICRLLNEKGYDGIVYSNQREDAGSTSWIITRPEQAISLFELRALNIPCIIQKKLEPALTA